MIWPKYGNLFCGKFVFRNILIQCFFLNFTSLSRNRSFLVEFARNVLVQYVSFNSHFLFGNKLCNTYKTTSFVFHKKYFRLNDTILIHKSKEGEYINNVVDFAKYLFSLSVDMYMCTHQIGYYCNVYQCADKASSVFARIQDSC